MLLTPDVETGGDLPFGVDTSAAAPVEIVAAVVPLAVTGNPGVDTSVPPLEIVTVVVPLPVTGSAVVDPPRELQPPDVATALHAEYFCSHLARHCPGKMHLPEFW